MWTLLPVRVGRRRNRGREDERHRPQLRLRRHLGRVAGAVERHVHRPHDVEVRRALDDVQVGRARPGHARDLGVRPAGGRGAQHLVAVQRRVAGDGVPGELDAVRRGADDVQPARRCRRGRVTARVHCHDAGVRRRRAVRHRPVEIGVEPVDAAGRRVAVDVVERSRVLGQQARLELVVRAGVHVEGRVDPRPRRVAGGVRAVRPEAELREQARSRPRLRGLAVDPHLAVDGVGPVDDADRVGQRGRPLHVRPADRQVRNRGDLVRVAALVAGAVERPDDVVDALRVPEARVRERRRGRVADLDPAAARERAAVDVVLRGAADGVPGERDLVRARVRHVQVRRSAGRVQVARALRARGRRGPGSSRARRRPRR